MQYELRYSRARKYKEHFIVKRNVDEVSYRYLRYLIISQ